MVMGGDSCSEDHGFESQCSIWDGHNIFTHIFVVRIVIFFEKTKINEKEAWDGPIFKTYTKNYLIGLGPGVSE